MPTVAERYNFAEVEKDGTNFISGMFKQCKVFEVENVTLENVMKMGNKDVIAKQLMCALQLIERQHNLIVNQRVHVSTYQQDIIKLQSDVIDAQNRALRVSERPNKLRKLLRTQCNPG